MKTTSKIFFTICLLTFIIQSNVFSQGCVAIRSTGGLCSMDEHPDSLAPQGSWLFNSNSRYFKSYKHFVGKAEQYQRIDQGTNVINHSYTQDLTLTRNFNNRWSLALDAPIIYNERSSLYEHGGKQRQSTYAFGIGDVSLTGYVWLFNPKKSRNGNIQVGLGLKLPTGNDNVQSYFYNVGPYGSKRLGPVDQSIQLGDGGTGIITEANTYYNITHKFGLYGTFYYLISPTDVNGISTARGGTPSASAIANTSDVMSVPDQALIRVGGSLAVDHFDFSGGIRYEVQPVHDLIGGSDGFRRPGRIFSGEPGVTFRTKKVSLYAIVPIAIIRDRTQSEPDLRTTQLTGVATHGDAAFADYVVNIGVSFKF
jgi:hypothetical protein